MDIAAWVFIVLCAVLAAVHRGWLCALLRRTEDPRTLGLFRVAAGGLLLAWTLDLVPLADYLFSGDGLVSGASARARFGRGVRWSWLYGSDSPKTVRIYLALMGASCTALTLGLGTRVAKWTTLLLLQGLVSRNAVYLGGEQVLSSFLFYLCLSKCGEAYSVDRWLAARRGAVGLTAIPAWPRLLMILQLVPMFFANGLAKSGAMWRDGDVFYYLINHPHFARAEMWGVSAIAGTNLFRAMTWAAHVFELTFPLAVLGVFVRINSTLAWPELGSRGRRLAIVLPPLIGANIVVLAALRWPPDTPVHLPLATCLLGGAAIGLAPLGILRRLPRRWIDVALGRGPWVTVWVALAAQLFFALRIGWFTGLTLCAAILFFDGAAIGRAMAKLRLRPLETEPNRPPMTRGRGLAVLAICALHTVAVSSAILPRNRPAAHWRSTLERPLKRWLEWTTGAQTWRMFAPNGARAVTDLEVVMVDGQGREHSVGAGLVDAKMIDSPWSLIKRHKIRRRISGRNGARFRAEHARWACRKFGGALHGEVTVVVYGTRMVMPPPAALAADRAAALAQYDRSLRREPLYESACASL